MNTKEITFEYLIANRGGEAEIVDTCEGCQLWELADGSEYVVLSDNTVITRAEDIADGDALFPL